LHDEQAAIAYVYFDYKDRRQTASNVVAWLLKQVLEQFCDIPKELVDLYKERGLETPRLDFRTTLRIFCNGSFPGPAYIIMDAFDECAVGERKYILEFILHIIKTENRIRILLTSRPHVQALQCLKPIESSLEITAHEDDVRTYVETRLDDEHELAEVLRAEILKKLSAGAQGMYDSNRTLVYI
jgi:hypothetical protein